MKRVVIVLVALFLTACDIPEPSPNKPDTNGYSREFYRMKDGRVVECIQSRYGFACDFDHPVQGR